VKIDSAYCRLGSSATVSIQAAATGWLVLGCSNSQGAIEVAVPAMDAPLVKVSLDNAL
jgi:hypothetical protein